MSSENKIQDDILSYREMCEEIQTLQRGMNFRLRPSYSVILMSQRPNAPTMIASTMTELQLSTKVTTFPGSRTLTIQRQKISRINYPVVSLLKTGCLHRQ